MIQSEPKKQDKSQISAKSFYNVSDSELKFLQRVRFWTESAFLGRVRFRIKIVTTHQIFNWNFYNVSDSELSFLQRVRIWIKIFTLCQIFN